MTMEPTVAEQTRAFARRFFTLIEELDSDAWLSAKDAFVRTLEACASPDGEVASGRGDCSLFIYPGYRFRAVDAMITNFHLPRSTLLMLVSAFAGRERILAAYREAIESEYRFYSYGDAMLIAGAA